MEENAFKVVSIDMGLEGYYFAFDANVINFSPVKY